MYNHITATNLVLLKLFQDKDYNLIFGSKIFLVNLYMLKPCINIEKAVNFEKSWYNFEVKFFFYNIAVPSHLLLLAWTRKSGKGQLNSEWIYEVIVSPKMQT